MKVAVALEQRFVRWKDEFWTDSVFDYQFWARYLDAFEEVFVLARVREGRPGEHAKRVVGSGVHIVALPDYRGPFQYVCRRHAIAVAMANAMERLDVLIVRAPSEIGTQAVRLWRGRSLALEIVGDPWDAFSAGSVRHPLRAIFRMYFAAQLKQQAKSAVGVSYVTSWALQNRYPASEGAVTASYSSIELPAASFVDTPRTFSKALERPRLVSIGTLEQMYKGFDVLLQAVRSCGDQGMVADLTIIGGGQHQAELQALAERLGISGQVRFTGALPPGAAVRDELDRADLFVLASRAEGLPRVVIEAMARGLPAVATRVGGVPELIDTDYLVSPGDPAALAKAILAMTSSTSALNEQAKRNLEMAASFRSDVLTARRRAFYQEVRLRGERR